jgi:chitinase
MRRWGVPALLAGALSLALGVVVAPAQADVEGAHPSGPRTVGYYTQRSGYDRNILVRNLVANGTAMPT